jgi:uncharacterized protein (DUF1697 family)
MAELRKALLDLGLSDVQTYIQSGNVVFRSPRGAAKVAAEIESQLGRDFGAEIKVLLRTHEQLRQVVRRNPLVGSSRDVSKLHVTFLAEAPGSARGASLDATSFPPDEFRLLGREVYIHCPDGYGKTKINNAFFERSLGVAATTRNWKTVTTLATMSAG